MTTTGGNTTDIIKPYNSVDFYVGLTLAISSSGFIGASFIIKKKALIRLQRYGSVRASSGGFGYLKEWIWWAGLLSMGIGETANFTAYAFAPASLVTPLGALSVLVAAVLASKYLNEKLNLLGKMGCFLCVIGSTMIVLHSPKEEEISSLDDLLTKLSEPAFILYVVIITVGSVLIVSYFGPIFGRTSVVVYTLLCSSVGSLTVMGCKGLGLAIKQTISSETNQFRNWLTWALLLAVILCITVQMNYLNKALDLFNTGIVTPVYYVFFTTLVIIASAILFREWEHMSPTDVMGSICGFLTVIVAILLLNAFKDMDISYNDIRGILRPKRETVMNATSRWDARDEESLMARSESEVEHSYGTPDVARAI